jgi:1-acyl-sn-glycerol-3-phosphate acyltransferase
MLMKFLRAALRFFLFVAATLGLYGVWFVADFFVSRKQAWRQAIFGAWARAFVKIGNVKIKVAGAPPKAPFFLVSNHLSYTDVPVLRAVVEGVFVAKGEIESWFVAGPIVRDMGAIFINRQNRRDIPRAGSEILERLAIGEGVIVFPEGTSTKGETVLPFNSSFLEFAARADLPVSYVSISYATFDGEPGANNLICWWEDISFGAHLFRLFKLRGFAATVTFGDEPILKTNRKELAQTLQQKIIENFVPVL